MQKLHETTVYCTFKTDGRRVNRKHDVILQVERISYHDHEVSCIPQPWDDCVRSGTLNGELIAGLKETAFCGEAQQVGERRSIDSSLQNMKPSYHQLEHDLLTKFG